MHLNITNKVARVELAVQVLQVVGNAADRFCKVFKRRSLNGCGLRWRDFSFSGGCSCDRYRFCRLMAKDRMQTVAVFAAGERPPRKKRTVVRVMLRTMAEAVRIIATCVCVRYPPRRLRAATGGA